MACLPTLANLLALTRSGYGRTASSGGRKERLVSKDFVKLHGGGVDAVESGTPPPRAKQICNRPLRKTPDRTSTSPEPINVRLMLGRLILRGISGFACPA